MLKVHYNWYLFLSNMFQLQHRILTMYHTEHRIIGLGIDFCFTHFENPTSSTTIRAKMFCSNVTLAWRFLIYWLWNIYRWIIDLLMHIFFERSRSWSRCQFWCCEIPVAAWLQFSCFQFPSGDIRWHEGRCCLVLEDRVSEMVDVALVSDAFATDIVDVVLFNLTNFAFFLAQSYIVNRFTTRSYRQNIGMHHSSKNKIRPRLSTVSS